MKKNHASYSEYFTTDYTPRLTAAADLFLSNCKTAFDSYRAVLSTLKQKLDADELTYDLFVIRSMAAEAEYRIKIHTLEIEHHVRLQAFHAERLETLKKLS